MTVQKLLNEVWPRVRARGATITIHWRTQTRAVTAVAYRELGDRVERNEVSFAVDPILASPGTLLNAIDDAIAIAVSELRDLTDSDALEAGERRRSPHGDWWDQWKNAR